MQLIAERPQIDLGVVFRFRQQSGIDGFILLESGTTDIESVGPAPSAIDFRAIRRDSPHGSLASFLSGVLHAMKPIPLRTPAVFRIGIAGQE